MARGVRASPAIATPTLPKVSFEKVEDDLSTQPAGVHDLQARSYGYNDFSEFRRPDSYIRHIEPLESDLARQVEYDMDEQDQEWLDTINNERRKEQLDKVSYETFEVTMDRLEKEWFDLTKNIPKQDFAMPSEDSTCAICDDSEGENSNAIVFCDGCNLAVHQDCYGVPYIPEGQWLCRKCTVSPENPVSCILCPNEGGAFKQTVLGEWVHLLCAMWIPETRVANEVFMEPVANVDKISKQRWKLKCSICEIREGACIQCAKTSCFLAFHATCARQQKLLLPMKSTQGSEPVTLTSYCERHLPKEQQDAREAAFAAEEQHESGVNSTQSPSVNAKLSKSARAYAKTYKPGPPLVPAIIVQRILTYISKVMIRKKAEFVQTVCRYWSLKREARRGAPLLKRLHLEPWTASATGKVLSTEERKMKLNQLRHLREDLQRVRDLAELCRKRETRKLRQAEIIQDILSRALFPHEAPLRFAFERITSLDRHDYFKNPVSKTDVPDYFDVVKQPMCWSVIDTKLDKHEYWDRRAFENDIRLVLDNAMLYNKPGTTFYKAAARIKTSSQYALDDLNKLNTIPTPSMTNGHQVNGDMDVDSASEAPSEVQLGNLEPPLSFLDLLVSSDAIKDGTRLILDHDPITSLFNYELARLKPPPTPPTPPRALTPPPPKVSKAKAKRERKESIKRPKNDGGEPSGIPLLLHAPRTRGAAAASARFEAEANIAPEVSTSTTSAVPESTTEPEETQTTETPAPPKRKRRSTMNLTGPGTMPQMVDDVDNQRSFKMFDAGWILSPEQRRGGRAPVERQILPPPKKKMRLGASLRLLKAEAKAGVPKADRGSSRLSVFSTTASDNQTLRSQPPTEEEPSSQGTTDMNPDQMVAMELTSAPTRNQSSRPATPPTTEGTTQTDTRQTASAAEAEPTSATSEDFPATLPELPTIDGVPPGKYIKSASGAIIIEELDSPAIRRQKAIHRKAQKERLAAEESLRAVANAPSSSESAGAGPSRVIAPFYNRGEKFEMDSDLSSLSDLGSEEAPPHPSTLKGPGQAGVELPPLPTSTPISTSMPPPPSPPKVEPGIINLDGGKKKLEGGTLVWAKADSFPWWPAVVFEEDDDKIPPNILKNYRTSSQKRKTGLHIIQFYDNSRSWQYLTLDRLRMLAENDDLDQDMIAPNSRRNKFKSATSRNECRAAYRLALSEMETGSEVEEKTVPVVDKPTLITDKGAPIEESGTEDGPNQPSEPGLATAVEESSAMVA